MNKMVKGRMKEWTEQWKNKRMNEIIKLRIKEWKRVKEIKGYMKEINSERINKIEWRNLRMNKWICKWIKEKMREGMKK